MDPDLTNAVNALIKRQLEELLLKSNITGAGGVGGLKPSIPGPALVLEKRDEETVQILFYIFVGILGLAALIVLINCLGTLCYACGRGAENDREERPPPPPPPIFEIPLNHSRRGLGVAVKPFSGFRSDQPPSVSGLANAQPKVGSATPAGPPKPRPKPKSKPKKEKPRSRSRTRSRSRVSNV